MIGISHPKNIEKQIEYEPEGVMIIKYNRPKKGAYKAMRYFNDKTIYEIDILLDCNTGRVNFCMVGEIDKFQPTFWNIDDFENGWVPYFDVYWSSKNVTIQIAKIDPSLYGIPIHDIAWK